MGRIWRQWRGSQRTGSGFLNEITPVIQIVLVKSSRRHLDSSFRTFALADALHRLSRSLLSWLLLFPESGVSTIQLYLPWCPVYSSLPSQSCVVSRLPVLINTWEYLICEFVFPSRPLFRESSVLVHGVHFCNLAFCVLPFATLYTVFLQVSGYRSAEVNSG